MQPSPTHRPADSDPALGFDLSPDPANSFASRHIGVTSERDIAQMLAALELHSIEELVDAAVPADIRSDSPLDLPPARSEAEIIADLRALAAKNSVYTQMIGQGFFGTHTPAVIRRGVLESPGWYTAYTPYQPEISQGRLEALLNFQTMVADLTALPIANASMLDEASATVEAVLLMRRATRASDSAKTLVDANIYPQTLAVLRGRAEALGIKVEVVDLSGGLPEGELSGIVLQQPGNNGAVLDHAALIHEAKERGAMVTVIADLLSLTLLTPPGEQGADIAVGTTQRFGVPLFFGGPHAAYLAVREGLERSLPGRLVGVSRDDAGKPAYRLALQTREQHIRRERATSNICTAQALLAVIASMYAVYHGPEGLKQIALRVHAKARSLADVLAKAGIELESESFFDTLFVRVPGRAENIIARAEARGINLRHVDAHTVGISMDETTTPAHLTTLSEIFSASLGKQVGDPARALADIQGTEQHAEGAQAAEVGFDPQLRRTSTYLTHENFNTVRSETQMMRYLRKLEGRDLALDRTMIPLGSCTMKLNAAAELEAITWPEFADIHPYAPEPQSAGWRELIADLCERLRVISGYAALSVQPNSGAQGEVAGLIAIRRYLRDRGEASRDVCLIPGSAHGTNAASAVLAGMRVVVVKNDATGDIDLADLTEKLDTHGDRLAVIMLTYPSTYGRYDTRVREVCERVHEAGGQVYIDGANLNALVGLAKPGEFGGDVSHLNLHKTFAIPHGGGGPGVGPIGVAEHLVPYLPTDPASDALSRAAHGQGAGHVVGDTADSPTASHAVMKSGVGIPLVSTLFGSAGVLPISYAYLAMMGAEGLTRATQTALLSANYIAARLRPHFPILYTGERGFVAHECIIDLRELTAASGVTAEDVAKRLIDFGFHAPTLAFPVPGTLMIEPTESEDLAEIDRFIEAMRQIRTEIDLVIAGEYAVADSPLRGAPHTALAVTAVEWNRPYTREQAAYPVASMRSGLGTDKYFPPVGRIDQAHGDRNLVCACPPPEAFETTGDAAHEPGSGEMGQSEMGQDQ